MSGAASAPSLVVARLRARALALDLAPRICVRSLAASRSRGPLGAGPNFLTPFCSRNAASSAPSRGKVIGSRQNTMRVHPSLPSTFLHGFARQYRTCDTHCTGALFNTLLSQYCLRTATCSAPNSFVAAKLRRNATHTYTKGDRAALERPHALLRACS